MFQFLRAMYKLSARRNWSLATSTGVMIVRIWQIKENKQSGNSFKEWTIRIDRFCLVRPTRKCAHIGWRLGAPSSCSGCSKQPDYLLRAALACAQSSLNMCSEQLEHVHRALMSLLELKSLGRVTVELIQWDLRCSNTFSIYWSIFKVIVMNTSQCRV